MLARQCSFLVLLSNAHLMSSSLKSILAIVSKKVANVATINVRCVGKSPAGGRLARVRRGSKLVVKPTKCQFLRKVWDRHTDKARAGGPAPAAARGWNLHIGGKIS